MRTPLDFNSLVIQNSFVNGDFIRDKQGYIDGDKTFCPPNNFLKKFYGDHVLAYRGLKLPEFQNAELAILNILAYNIDDNQVNFSLNPCVSSFRFVTGHYLNHPDEWKGTLTATGIVCECLLPTKNVNLHGDSESGPLNEAGVNYTHKKDHWTDYITKIFLITDKDPSCRKANKTEIQTYGLSDNWVMPLFCQEECKPPWDDIIYVVQGVFKEELFKNCPRRRITSPADQMNYWRHRTKKTPKWYRAV